MCHLPPVAKVDSANRFAVNQLSGPPGLRNSLYLNSAAASYRYIYILPAGADTRSDMTCAAADASDEQYGFDDLFGSPEIRSGNRFDERHAQAVGAPDDEMTAVENLSAAVLFHTDLCD